MEKEKDGGQAQKGRQENEREKRFPAQIDEMNTKHVTARTGRSKNEQVVYIPS